MEDFKSATSNGAEAMFSRPSLVYGHETEEEGTEISDTVLECRRQGGGWCPEQITT